MCRFAAYLGPEISIASLTTLPSHSIVKQSYRAQEREEPLNGDGFGVAWYAADEEPAAYRAVTPAWNDENLMHLARVSESGCIFAHVRAASPGLGVSPFNCHPFLAGRYAFMHNGYIAGFPKIKRRLLRDLPEELWYGVRGTTDSETLFAVFQDELTRCEGKPAPRMRDALVGTIRRLLEVSREVGVEEAHQLNLCVTDGTRLAVTRFNSNVADEANSLYVHEGRRYVCVGGLCQMIEPDERGGAVLVASERLSDDEGWSRIPGNHVLWVGEERSPTIEPIVV